MARRSPTRGPHNSVEPSVPGEPVEPPFGGGRRLAHPPGPAGTRRPAGVRDVYRQYRFTALAAAAILAGAALALRAEGRAWLCRCGRVLLWVGDAWSPETSQQFLDPYSLTHVLHGFVLCGVLALLARGASVRYRFLTALGVEALWEILENSSIVIARYRTATAALGYTGDTVINSLGDILCCALGFVIAHRAGLRWTAVLFAATEVALMAWIRDSLSLDVLMLIYPVGAIRRWQLGQ